jgi:DnaJ-domain-containing protein 1
MTDCFAALEEPRRPWLDAQALREKFLTLSAAAHPDRSHAAPQIEKELNSVRYAELNAAFTRLREPKDRLAHLIELELGRRPADIQAVPADAMELFVQVGQLCREADEFLANRAAVTSPLVRVQWFARGLVLADRVAELQRTLQSQQDKTEAELQAMNEAWAVAPPSGSIGRAARLPLARLEEIYRVLSYTTRWRAQLQERFVQLSL